MSTTALMWGGFCVLIAGLLALDLGVFHRKAHTVRFKEAMLWVFVWTTLALLFNLGIFYWKGPEVALQFLTGYLIEQSLSVDNIFIFILVFSYFKVPPNYQHKVLFWGIVGAIVMRISLILVGTALIHRFHWILYVFGAFLVITGIKMAFQDDTGVHPENNRVVRWFRKLMPVTRDYYETHFFLRQGGRLFATPLLIVLIVIETTDLVFALDSIPAIFAITTDPFIVFTSNIFAILGLRSLYFMLSGFMTLFHYLKFGLAFILSFVGVKMLVAEWYKIPIGAALVVVAVVLLLSVVASLIWPVKKG